MPFPVLNPDVGQGATLCRRLYDHAVEASYASGILNSNAKCASPDKLTADIEKQLEVAQSLLHNVPKRLIPQSAYHIVATLGTLRFGESPVSTVDWITAVSAAVSSAPTLSSAYQEEYAAAVTSKSELFSPKDDLLLRTLPFSFLKPLVDRRRRLLVQPLLHFIEFQVKRCKKSLKPVVSSETASLDLVSTALSAPCWRALCVLAFGFAGTDLHLEVAGPVAAHFAHILSALDDSLSRVPRLSSFDHVWLTNANPQPVRFSPLVVHL